MLKASNQTANLISFQKNFILIVPEKNYCFLAIRAQTSRFSPTIIFFMKFKLLTKKKLQFRLEFLCKNINCYLDFCQRKWPMYRILIFIKIRIICGGKIMNNLRGKHGFLNKIVKKSDRFMHFTRSKRLSSHSEMNFHYKTKTHRQKKKTWPTLGILA